MKTSTFINGILIGLILSITYNSIINNINKKGKYQINKDKNVKELKQPTIVKIVSNNYPKTISSRGETHFKQIGMLINEKDKLTLPLFGKPIYRGSSNWNYYTYVNTFNQILLPLEIDNRDCMTDIGCKELFDDDSIFISSYGVNFNVKLYNIGLTVFD